MTTENLREEDPNARLALIFVPYTNGVVAPLGSRIEEVRIPLLLRKCGEYDLPGGKVFVDERPAIGLRREFAAETGIRIQNARFIDKKKHPLPARALKGIHRIFYQADYAGGIPQNLEPDQHHELRMATPAEALELTGNRLPGKIQDAIALHIWREQRLMAA